MKSTLLTLFFTSIFLGGTCKTQSKYKPQAITRSFVGRLKQEEKTRGTGTARQMLDGRWR
jgi:hypothetical protein